MPRKHIDVQLKCLLNEPFELEHAMHLVRSGADPDTKNYKGTTLLHFLSYAKYNVNGKYDQAIEELVNTYHADINIQDGEGFTPLQRLIDGPFDTEAAMKLVRLGAYPDTKDRKKRTLLDLLSSSNKNGKNNQNIEDLTILSIKYCKERHHQPRNFFLNLLVRLSNDRANTASSSYFKYLPIEVLSYIMSFLDSNNMGKTPKECYDLSVEILSKPKKIKEMASTPGGINIFQHDNKNNSGCHKSTFFKSAQTFCQDVENLKLKLDYPRGSSGKILDEFIEKHAISYWIEHSSLYKKPSNKTKLLNSIKNNDPYKREEIKSKMNLS